MSPKSAMQEVIKMSPGLTFHGMGIYDSTVLTYGDFLRKSGRDSNIEILC